MPESGKAEGGKEMTGMREGAYGALNVRSVLLAAVSLAAFAPQTAMAQESASDDQDSQLIVVTAQRREQSIIETPIAVSIASGEQLRNNDVTVASDLTK